MSEVYIPEEIRLTEEEQFAVQEAVAASNLFPSFFYDFDSSKGNRWVEDGNSQGIYEGPGYNPADEDQLKIVGLPPFANNFPHNRLRDAVASAAIDFSRKTSGEGTAAALHVANNTRSISAFNYSTSDLEKFHSGSFVPFSDRILRFFDEDGLKGPIVLSGQSQGGSVALAIANRISEYYDVRGVASTEPTTFVDQSPKQQKKAFIKGGLVDMNAAVLESGVKEAAKMLHIRHDTSRQNLRQLINSVSFARGAMTDDNDAIKVAMASDRGFEDLRDLNDAAIRTSVLSGAASLILPEEVMVELKEEFKDDNDSVSIIISRGSTVLVDNKGNAKPHGHGIGDNIAAIAGLALKVARKV